MSMYCLKEKYINNTLSIGLYTKKMNVGSNILHFHHVYNAISYILLNLHRNSFDLLKTISVTTTPVSISSLVLKIETENYP